MSKFFKLKKPANTITYNNFTFDLPILYFRDDFFGLYFTANQKKIEQLMPSDNLHPIVLPGGRAVVVVLAINYINTSIGPYGEVPVVIPVIYGKKPSPGASILAALLESKYPGFGVLVQHLPVTRAEARDAGRGEWGYTKFIADMHFQITPEFMFCRMAEQNQHILDLRVERKGFYLKDRKPLVTYSVNNRKLIKTIIPQKSVKRIAVFPSGGYLKLGHHPVAQSIADLELSKAPFMSIYFPERAGILPAGKVIEENVTPFEGYLGQDQTAEHTVKYI
jgi:hypothetical protein